MPIGSASASTSTLYKPADASSKSSRQPPAGPSSNNSPKSAAGPTGSSSPSSKPSSVAQTAPATATKQTSRLPRRPTTSDGCSTSAFSANEDAAEHPLPRNRHAP